MPEILGPLKKKEHSNLEISTEDTRRLFKAALQTKLARAKAEAEAQNFMSQLDVPIDDVFELTPPVTTRPEVYVVDNVFESIPSSSVTTTTTHLTTPQKSVKKRTLSPVRAGDKLDFLRYQSSVKQKEVAVGQLYQSSLKQKVVSPSIKDTFRGLYQPPVGRVSSPVAKEALRQLHEWKEDDRIEEVLKQIRRR
jgi:hypothetical protein